jgi:hypothetical protein
VEYICSLIKVDWLAARIGAVIYIVYLKFFNEVNRVTIHSLLALDLAAADDPSCFTGRKSVEVAEGSVSCHEALPSLSPSSVNMLKAPFIKKNNLNKSCDLQ